MSAVVGSSTTVAEPSSLVSAVAEPLSLATAVAEPLSSVSGTTEESISEADLIDLSTQQKQH